MKKNKKLESVGQGKPVYIFKVGEQKMNLHISQFVSYQDIESGNSEIDNLSEIERTYFSEEARIEHEAHKKLLFEAMSEFSKSDQTDPFLIALQARANKRRNLYQISSYDK